MLVLVNILSFGLINFEKYHHLISLFGVHVEIQIVQIVDDFFFTDYVILDKQISSTNIINCDSH